MKHILRNAVKDLLPADVYNRTDKKGMPTPIAPWFRGELSTWVQQSLTSPQAVATGLFSRAVRPETLDDHLSGTRRHKRGTVEAPERHHLVADLR